MSEQGLALVIANLGCGGAQRVVTTMANAWAASGRQITIITVADGSSDFFSLDPRVRRIAIAKSANTQSAAAALAANIRRVFRLRRALRSADAPVLVSFVAPTNILLVLAAFGLGRRIVISERNDPRRQSFGPIWDRLRRLLYRRADLVTANSHEALKAMSRYVPSRKLAYLPNPIAVPADADLRPHAQPTILSVGRLDCQKAHDILIDAFTSVAVRHPAWRLMILGEGPQRRDLERQIADSEFANRIVLEGTVDDPSPFYESSDIFSLASRHEGTANALLEAMAFGLPPIVSNRSSGALDFVADGETGLVVSAEDPASLAQALNTLMADQDARQTLGRAARSRVEDQRVDAVMPIWEQVLGLD